MARAKPAKSEVVELEDESRDVEDSEVGGTDEDEIGSDAGLADDKPITKARAARAAIDQGIESPQKASAYILEQFGIEMAPQHFSAVKSQLRKKERQAGAAGLRVAPARRGRRPAVENYVAPPPRQASPGVEGDLLDAMEAIKPLVASLGADKVRRIVELLG